MGQPLSKVKLPTLPQKTREGWGSPLSKVKVPTSRKERPEGWGTRCQKSKSPPPVKNAGRVGHPLSKVKVPTSRKERAKGGAADRRASLGRADGGVRPSTARGRLSLHVYSPTACGG
ncbi:hypothetical protein SBA1_890005 [Candidatus Sulfotelmatobacter kueseliae]|uniref:Uncharacterized protein n=1 Tax=Candidatus Sulfotelmatobacter kueseliae TaxID=2042962 RepID=A0A2U3LAI0_9BACT|nr:hypothetical protein SBA1_890005 [Candidatus Sulfotelmatobacter kueseliae]